MYIKHRLKFSKWLLLGLATPIPALVAIACGNLDATVNQALPPIDTATLASVGTSASAYLASVSRLVPNDDSVSEAITWPAVPPLPAQLSGYYEPVQFSAQKDDGTPGAWASTLPSRLPAPFTARILTARLAPKPVLQGVIQKVSATFPPARLAEIKVDVTRLSTYRAPVFAELKLVGSAEALRFEGTTLSSEVATFLKWQFALRDQEFLDEQAFLTYLTTNRETITQGDLATTRAQLIAITPTDSRVLFTTQSGLVDTETVKPLFPVTARDQATITRTAEEYLDALTMVRPLATSTHAQVAWPSLPVFPSFLATYYEAPQFSTSEASDATKQWVNSLPTAIASDFSARFLAVRLVVKTNTLGLTTRTRDFSSTALSEVKTDVVQLASYRAPDFNVIKLAGATLNDLSLEGISLSAEVAKFISWKFTIKDAARMSASAFITYLQANGASLTDVEVAGTTAELSAVDASEARVIFTPVSQLLNTAAVAKLFVPGAPDKASVTLTANRYLAEVVETKVEPNSTHASLVWNTFAPLPDALAPYYQAPEFSINAELGDRATWVSVLPKSIISDFAARRIDVRLRPKANSLALETLTKPFPAATLTSVKVDVAKLATYTPPSFTKLAVRGVLANPFIDGLELDPAVKVFLSWTFTIANSPRLRPAELIEYLKANDGGLDQAAIDSLRAELALTNPQDLRAVFAPVQGQPDTSALAGFARPALRSSIYSLLAALENLKVQPGTMHSAATWTNLPVPGPEIAEYYKPPEYFFSVDTGWGFEEHFFITNHKSWPATRSFQPPTQLNPNLDEQRLYVLIALKPTAPNYLVSRALDITETSGIRRVRIDLTALPSFTKLATAGVSASIALNDPANLSVSLGANFDTDDTFADLRANANLEFQLANGPWLNPAAMAAQIKRDYLTFDARAFRTLRWRLQPKNVASYATNDITPRLVTITSAMYAPVHTAPVTADVAAELDRLRAALDNNIRFNTAKPSYYDNALYQRPNYTLPGASEPTRLSLNAAPFTSFLREPGANGEAPLVTLYWRTEINGAWHNANDTSSRQNYLLPNVLPLLPPRRVMQIRLDYAGNSLGLVSEVIDLTASSSVRNLLLSFENAHTTIASLQAAFRALHVKPGSTADNLEWPSFPITDGDLRAKTAYGLPEYSTSPFLSAKSALESPSQLWSLGVPPLTINNDPALRHLWVRVRIDLTKGIPVTDEVSFVIDLTELSGIRDVPAA